jgi:outer membrane murein-binding lipoprotein Lpp
MKQQPIFFTAVIATIFLLSSCVSHKKIAKLYSKVQSQKQAELHAIDTIKALASYSENKVKEGAMDDSSGAVIKKILGNAQDSSAKRVATYTAFENSLKSASRIKAREFKKMAPQLAVDSEPIKEQKENIDFVNALLNKNTFVKFNSAVFFGPGGYIIPDDKIPLAKTIFAPIVDSLIDFVQKFPQRQLFSTVVSCGYADGQGFNQQGDLYKELSKNIGKEAPTNPELNVEISRLRADNITGILKAIFAEKQAANPALANFNIDFFKAGKGEEYPNKNIVDYKVEDDRRRIVIIYWSALPKL